jgi:hypothetical protein
MLENLAATQRDWHGWTLRGAGRLAEAQRIIAERRLPAWGTGSLNCSPPAVMPAAPPPVIEMNAVDANVLVPEDNAAAGPLTEKAAR